MSEQNGNQEQPEIIIVGAGPAGQSAALYAGRSRIPTLVLERGIPGGQLWNTAEVEDYPGFEHIMGPDLAERMQKHAEKFGARFETAEVESISADGEDRKSTRLNSSHANISYAVFCLKKKDQVTTLLATSIVREQDTI